jgi:HAD superfamily hydrolase (TIGR01509 family)
MIRGIIFDCFGVLHLDSNTAYFMQFPQQQEAIHNLNMRADHGFIDREGYLAEASELIDRSPEEILQAIATGSVLNQLMIEYIKQQLKPHYKIGMVSNMGRGWIQDFFDEHQLHDIFDVVVLSSEEGITKPNPLIFERTAERLDLLPNECLMVDDRADNCRGATMAGMKAVQFTSNDQLIAALTSILTKENQ